MDIDSLKIAADSLQIAADTLSTAAQNFEGAREISIGLGGNDLLNPDNIGLGTVILGIVGIFGVFFVPFIAIVSIVWFSLSHKRKEKKLQAELISKAIEQGQTIPENLLETKKKSPLNRGIMWIAVGLGLQLFFIISGVSLTVASKEIAASGVVESDMSSTYGGVGFAMIPLFVGLGYLLIHFFEKKEKQEENGSHQ
jgi:hypothetical protein